MRNLLRLAALPLLVLACGSQDPGSGSQSGDIEIRLVDAPSTTVTQIVVTITRVEAHVNGQWQTLSSATKTVDLLTLQGGTFALLGVTTIPAGKITQFRLYVTDAGPNYVTTPDTKQHPLTVPSGDESGIKLKANIDVNACAQGSITLDFDGKNSIFTHPVGAGAGDEWILRPVIRMKEVALSGSCGDASIPSNDSGSPSTDSGAPSSDSGTSSGDGGSTIPPPVN
ncbi:MAG TPA: DUF4382 domain-containing protein [Polyangiaceae bacterium]|jgi:hypothetical protein